MAAPGNNRTKIDKEKWYTAREAGDLLDVTEGTIKKYCRDGEMQGRQAGPRQKWHVQGAEIIRFREKWGLDTIMRSQ